MMNSVNDMMHMAPQMMGCCSFGFFGMFAGLISMATPLIAVGAIVYLIAKRPQSAAGPTES